MYWKYYICSILHYWTKIRVGHFDFLFKQLVMNANKAFLLIVFSSISLMAYVQDITVSPPDKRIVFTITNGDKLNYAVTFNGRNIMDRDDQQMVNWYHDIIKCAAENHLMVDFHGAYKPDGIIRTYPNMITREGVMGNEYYKFSNKMSPEHNVKLAFTRMLAGQMDYTPGGFLNVTKEKYKNQTPTLIWNTRAAELSKHDG